jgi:hypothetical protein
VPRDEEGHAVYLQVGIKALSIWSSYVDPEHLDLTFQDTVDPRVEPGRVLPGEASQLVVVQLNERIEPDLGRVEGRELEPLAADVKQAVHEFPDLLHGLARDEQASGELPDVAPSPCEDARSHGLLRRQERQDLRQDLLWKLAEAVGGVDRWRWRSHGKGFLPAFR